MKAMVLNKLGSILDNNFPLILTDLPNPVPAENFAFTFNFLHNWVYSRKRFHR